jgi:hypothetical protein
MKLTDRLNVLIQATTVSQKNGILTLDEAVKAKTAIDIISAGTLNQNYASAINVLIEIAVSSQKKGIYSLKDAHMIYLAVDGMETELQNEVNRINNVVMMEEMNNNQQEAIETNTHVINSNETAITVPPKKLKKQ